MPTSSPSPLIIAHRGASGYRPEHTLASYELAIEQGADYVEPDLVSTKDGVLICRHECEIGETTDVAQKFPARKRKAVFDGKPIEGWFAADFTLAEIKTLRARERLKFRDHQFDGHFEVPTFQEFLELVKARNKTTGRVIGICPELKHPTYHASQNLALEDPALRLLNQYGYDSADSPCLIQSFEITNLKYLAGKSKLRLLQLLGTAKDQPDDVHAAGGKLTYGDMLQPAHLKQIATYAWAIGPTKELILPRDKQNRLGQPTSLVADAHAAGLKVIIYTLRNEPQYLAADYKADPAAEYRHFRDLKIDALFTDFPDTAVAALRK